MNDLKDIAVTVGVGLLFLVLPVGVLTGLFSFLEAAKCDAQWPQHNHEYTLLGGCMVEHPKSSGEWVPASAIRVVPSQ